MKKLHFILVFVLGAIFISACDKDSDVVTTTNSYFPLEVGNYWVFNSQKREITGTKNIGNKNFFILNEGSFKSYWRVENNRVYQSDSTGNERLYFDLTAKVNDSWSSGEWNVTLNSKSQTVVINEKKFTNCYVFFFDVPMMIDEEHSITLAPNIGFIVEASGFSPPSINPYLEESRIGGKVTVY